MTDMIRIEGPHFVAAVILNRRKIVATSAPIVKYMRGWTAVQVLAYCARRKWKATYEENNHG